MHQIRRALRIERSRREPALRIRKPLFPQQAAIRVDRIQRTGMVIGGINNPLMKGRFRGELGAGQLELPSG
ncbi:hypothetical protein FHS14_004971 [Paenibacillus baekrokdamisoli]|nr:hypothetical protein [Paenibacillus baekrokdamisoli]